MLDNSRVQPIVADESGAIDISCPSCEMFADKWDFHRPQSESAWLTPCINSMMQKAERRVKSIGEDT
jgi:hypothetical protein